MEKVNNASLNEPNMNVNNIKDVHNNTLQLLNMTDLKMECEYDDCEQDKVHIQQSFIGENYIKQEPYDTSDPIENNTLRLAEIINCRSNIKLEDEEESITNNTETCIIDDKVIVQETIFLNDFKKESNETNRDLCCEKCNEEYELYCTKCSMLVRLLDSCVKNDIDSKAKKTLPKDILEIKNVFSDMRVYALKVIPEGTIFGPFEGLDSVPSTTGSTWRLKGGKLIYRENSEQRVNWMQYVNYVPHSSDQNLLVFQYQDRLYYRSTQKIDEGKELLVYYCQEQGNNLEDDESEMYLHPIVARDFKNVFACTYCCLGYGLEEDLLKHKTKCCSRINTEVPVEGIVQCPLCKIYMEKTEHSEYHIQYCWDKNSRKSLRSSTDQKTQTVVQNKIIIIADDTSSSDDEKFQCAHCTFESKIRASLVMHLRTHSAVKKYECSRCSFKTNNKRSYVIHDYTQHGFEKFICGECKEELTSKQTYELHMREKHFLAHSKVYVCENCGFGTVRYTSFKIHRKLHDRTKKLKCRKCPFETNDRYVLREHFNRHEDVVWHQCPKCPYKTDKRYLLKTHSYIHGDEKPFKCDKCDKQFTKRWTLVVHVREKHVIFGDEY